MRGRGYWIFQFILCLLVVIIFWAAYFLGHVPLQIAVLSPLSFLLLAFSYGLRRFAGAQISLWRGMFIFLGTFGIGFVIWIVLMIPRKLGLVDFPGYWAVTMLLALLIGAVIGDRLGKRRNYMPWGR